VDELLKNTLGRILETTQLSDSQKLEVISGIHILYKYLDIWEDED
jgi:hypothetical protein